MTKNSRIIIREAESLGLSVDIISEKDHLFSLSNGQSSLLVCELFSMTLNPNGEAYRLSKDKDLTYALWKRNQIPFPEYHHYRNIADFQKRISADDLKFPVITKDGSGSKSINVHMDIQSLSQLEEAAKTYAKGFLVQQMVIGKEYRLLIHNGRLLGALQMVPPHIIGDGVHTVSELITTANLKKEKKMKVTDSVAKNLEKSGYSLESTPAEGTVLMLQKNSRLSEGGESHDCTENVHPEVIALAWKAVAATNLRLGGVDLICSDISIAPKDQSIAFLEVNTYPDLSIHYEPTHGKPQPVVRMILEDLFGSSPSAPMATR